MADWKREITSKPFDFQVKNALGLEQKSSRDEIYTQALKNPELYLAQRKNAEELVINNKVQETYDYFKFLLSSGAIGDERSGESLKLPDGKHYSPRLPDSVVTSFALKASETMMAICTEAMEEIMPKDHKDLAHKKISDIAKIKDLE